MQEFFAGFLVFADTAAAGVRLAALYYVFQARNDLFSLSKNSIATYFAALSSLSTLVGFDPVSFLSRLQFSLYMAEGRARDQRWICSRLTLMLPFPLRMRLALA